MAEIGRRGSERARRTDALDRADETMSARLDEAERKQHRRDIWLDEHAHLIDARDLVTRAERAREIQIRVAAINNPDAAVRDLWPRTDRPTRTTRLAARRRSDRRLQRPLPPTSQRPRR